MITSQFCSSCIKSKACTREASKGTRKIEKCRSVALFFSLNNR